MAHADGFTPAVAAHYRAHLHKLAEGWRNVGMANAEGLSWHMAGFSAREAARLAAEGKTPQDARPVAGYGTAGLGRKS